MTDNFVPESRPQAELRFIADVHLGRLAKYLRMCGFDTLFQQDYDDREIIELSAKEGRIILTRDKDLLRSKKVRQGHLVHSDAPLEQIREILDVCRAAERIRPFTRCMECNGVMEHVGKEEIIDRLMPLTRDYYDEFKRCGTCGRIYWEGSHFARMKTFIMDLKSGK